MYLKLNYNFKYIPKNYIPLKKTIKLVETNDKTAKKNRVIAEVLFL